MRTIRWCRLGLFVICCFMLIDQMVGAQGTLKDVVRTLIDETYAKGNVAILDTLYASEYIRYPDETTADAARISILAFRASLPDLKPEIEVIIENKDRVAVRFWLRGTFANEFVAPGSIPIPPTSRPIELIAHAVYRFNEQGLIVEEWNTFDNFSFLSQLGVLPVEGMPAPTMTLYPQVVDVGMSEQNRLLVEQYVGAFNQGDFAFVDSTFKEDFTMHNPFGLLTRDGLKADLSTLRGAIPDLSIVPGDWVTEGNWTALRYTLSGNFTGEYVLGDGSRISPTNLAMNLPTITFFRFDQQGLVAEGFEVYDSLSFMSQLGLLQLIVPSAATPTPGG